MKRIAAFSSHDAEAIKREFPPIERSPDAVGCFQQSRAQECSADRKLRFVATNLSSFRPSPASGKEVAVILSRRTYGGQEESSQEGSSQEEGSEEEDREEEVAPSSLPAPAGRSCVERPQVR
jgi:hypothetical protein